MELVQETILPLKSINKLNSIFYVLILIFDILYLAPYN